MNPSIIDVIVAAMNFAGLCAYIPLFRRANGHRPFIVGHMLVLFVLLAGSVRGVVDDEEPFFYAILRISLFLIVVLTMVWALRKKAH